ncbi:hypothetical protein NHX12_028036 [Muraenolepis orangiensis]|uniref:tetrahydrofolate synthase n=1 Tax=Muraenolepis orangiensis TaxID=630683 RepID=A0A9Q0EGT8_9TELE|nr:hypothetical protein NHX12_028036 [Muraenolepis orangiensis]
MMVRRCSRMWRQRGSLFSALVGQQGRTSSSPTTTLLLNYSSTKAAPQLPGMEYQDAICTLNTLQTNASSLEQVRRERGNLQLQLVAMRGFLERAGLAVEDLDSLNIIHVTGTKGKDAHSGSMPAYFRFLTILSFHVFLQEKVDLAVIEVGIGGAYDCTNIIKKPWVCGVSSLGIDHTQILGDTIEKIAWQKGGIFKAAVPAFTVKQPDGAMTVLRRRAAETECPLWVCPELEDYQVHGGSLQLGLAGQHQRSNASLALQLSHTWLQRRCLQDQDFLPSSHQEGPGVPLATLFTPSPIMTKGLADTVWAGRTQTLRSGAVTYFLDGAHTTRSMQACVLWFQEAAASCERSVSGPVARVLVFNATGDRDSAAMLKLLVPCHFDFAVFCPNITEAIASCNADQQNFNVSVENMLTRCLDNERSWQQHHGAPREPLLIRDSSSSAAAEALVFPCILSALRWTAQGRDPVLLPRDAGQRVAPVKPSVAAKAAVLRDAAEIHVLVTGSLHLVGGVLKHLDPSVSSK